MAGDTPKPAPNPVDKEAEDVIKEWAKSAKENPRQHLEAFLKHMKGWLEQNQNLYKERKARYDAAVKQREKNPSSPLPFKDPFMVNYEEAQALANKLTARLAKPGDQASEQDEAKLNSPSDEVKKMVNMLWTRTIFPAYPMVSNVVMEGVRHIMFDNGSKLSVYPSGAITVTHEGETKRYLPPFPNVRMEFSQFRQG